MLTAGFPWRGVLQVYALEVQEDVNKVLFAVAPAIGSASGTSPAASGRTAACKGGGHGAKAAAAAAGSALAARLKQHVLADGAASAELAADIANMLDSLRVC